MTSLLSSADNMDFDYEEEDDYELNNLFQISPKVSFVKIGKEKFILPIYSVDNWTETNKFQVKDDDVFITGHPKTGTTWLHEVVNFIMRRSNTKNDIGSLLESHAFLDFQLIYPEEKLSQIVPDFKRKINWNNLESPRTIKTHLPWFLLPKQIRHGSKTPKIIHTLRNPKDTCISYYHFCKSLYGYTGDFEQFCELFLKGTLIYGPYSTTIKSYWEKRDEPNVFFVRYSQLRQNPEKTVKDIGVFLGKSLREEEVAKIVEQTSFDYMKKNIGIALDDVHKILSTPVNGDTIRTKFFREGEEGGYESIMSEKLIAKFDKALKGEFDKNGITF